MEYNFWKINIVFKNYIIIKIAEVTWKYLIYLINSMVMS